MGKGNLAVICAATVLGIAAIYAPQPLLPILRQVFGVSEATASLAVTATMLPLGLAPLAYGFFLESVSSKRLLGAAVLLLAACCLLLAACQTFGQFMALRLAMGLLVPALLTALMTYVSAAAAGGAINRVMAVYIAATVFGGFFGRFFAGASAELYGWRFPFLALGAGLAVCGLFTWRLPPDARSAFSRVGLAAAPALLRRPGFFKAYCVIGLLFFVFTAMLNMLPFRLAGLPGGYSALRAGFMYCGYLMGILVCVSAPRLVGSKEGEARAVAFGAAVVIAAAALYAAPSQAAMFASIVVLCSGMFLSHALAPGMVNRAAGQHRGLVNGLYISFYYTGGTLGSYLPGLIRERFGFTAAAGLLIGAAALALAVALTLPGHGFGAAARDD